MKRLAATIATVTITAGCLMTGATHANANPSIGTIAAGSTNVHGVWCVQRILNRNYPEANISETGNYGTNTQRWVRQFRIDSGYSAGTTVTKTVGDSLLASIGGDDYCWDHLPTTR